MKRNFHTDHSKALQGATLLLILATLVWVCTKISFLFTPLTTFLSTIMGPFLIAGFLYYLLQPIVKLLHLLKITGRKASVLAFVLLLVILIGGLAYLIPHAVTQISSLVQNLPQNIKHWESVLRDFAGSDLAKQLHINEIIGAIQIDQNTVLKAVSTKIGTGVNGVSAIVGHIGNTLVNVFMAPLVLFYFMKDGNKLSGNIQRFLPAQWRGFAARLLHRMNETMESYFTGQFTDMLFVGILSCIGYALTGTPYALIIGIAAGIMNMVPYIGPWLGAIPAVAVAATVSWKQMLLAVIVAVVVQQIDNNLIYPNVIGKSLEIHPLTVLVLLLTAGNMFGLLGVILGIPVYAVVKVILASLVEEPRIPFFNWMNAPQAQADDETLPHE
ncbi:AI-2E family transporter [Lacticaseibacillus jixiensis]|uniref:AI-2E family transporter n=1 Tax=Lacticaseibacillus jixiensis TaxID=3231926 RepID=UPI0036F3C51B